MVDDFFVCLVLFLFCFWRAGGGVSLFHSFFFFLQYYICFMMVMAIFYLDAKVMSKAKLRILGNYK